MHDFFLHYMLAVESQMRNAPNKGHIIKHLCESSTFNHHTAGLNYLCLHRTEDLTLKLYYIPKEINDNSGYLVHPHSHRYGFNTTVLYGEVIHTRFDCVLPAQRRTLGPVQFPSTEEMAGIYRECRYDWKTKKVVPNYRCKLRVDERVMLKAGDSYFVSPYEIHTLTTVGPLVLGIVQGPDVNTESNVYLPVGMDKLPVTRAKKVGYAQYSKMLKKVTALVNSNRD